MVTAGDFLRYLEAKRALDDRSLDRNVQEALLRALRGRKEHSGVPLRVLEVGSGIGTMAERLARAGVLKGATYTAIDQERRHTEAASVRLAPLEGKVSFELETAELFDFVARHAGRRRWDLVVAHAVLDLLPLEAALEALFSLLEAGGLYSFTLNFDGVTSLLPEVDPELDHRIERLYHRSMDERRVGGKSTGGSRGGSRLFERLRSAGATIEAAGSSDWVIVAGPRGYRKDDRVVLRHLLGTIEGELRGHPELEEERLAEWIRERHRQIEDRTLALVVHQLDFFGRVSPPAPRRRTPRIETRRRAVGGSEP